MTTDEKRSNTRHQPALMSRQEQAPLIYSSSYIFGDNLPLPSPILYISISIYHKIYIYIYIYNHYFLLLERSTRKYLGLSDRLFDISFPFVCVCVCVLGKELIGIGRNYPGLGFHLARSRRIPMPVVKNPQSTAGRHLIAGSWRVSFIFS